MLHTDPIDPRTLLLLSAAPSPFARFAQRKDGDTAGEAALDDNDEDMIDDEDDDEDEEDDEETASDASDTGRRGASDTDTLGAEQTPDEDTVA